MEWEPLKDFKINKDEKYLVCCDCSEVYMIKGSVIIDQNRKNKEREAKGWGGLYYTHIMPLPKPPKAI